MPFGVRLVQEISIPLTTPFARFPPQFFLHRRLESFIKYFKSLLLIGRSTSLFVFSDIVLCELVAFQSIAVNMTHSTMPIAIVGMSCRLPGGVSSPEDLWQICAEQRDVWKSIPNERMNNDAFYHPDPGRNGTVGRCPFSAIILPLLTLANSPMSAAAISLQRIQGFSMPSSSI